MPEIYRTCIASKMMQQTVGWRNDEDYSPPSHLVPISYGRIFLLQLLLPSIGTIALIESITYFALTILSTPLILISFGPRDFFFIYWESATFTLIWVISAMFNNLLRHNKMLINQEYYAREWVGLVRHQDLDAIKTPVFCADPPQN